LAQSPEDQIVNYHLGMALYQGGQMEEARLKLEKALEKDDDFIGRSQAEKVLAEIKDKG
jgi:uncharacterized protein HemY